jgi:hypothetical protein
MRLLSVAAAKLEFPEHARKVDDYEVDYLVKHPQRLER